MAAKKSKTARARRGARRNAAPESGASEATDLRLLARDAALAALSRLADLSRSEDERIALAATQELLNRAFGKTPPGGSEETPARPLVIKIVRFGKNDANDSQGGGQS